MGTLAEAICQRACHRFGPSKQAYHFTPEDLISRSGESYSWRAVSARGGAYGVISLPESEAIRLIPAIPAESDVIRSIPVILEGGVLL